MPTIAAAVLAAGGGKRMGGPKAELVVGSERLLDRAVRAAVDAGCAPVVAVVRAGTAVRDAVAVVNPDPDLGLRSSLAVAVEALPGVDALAVLLVDTPGITAVGVRATCAAGAAGRPDRLAAGRYTARRGHPTVMAPVLWGEALALASPDEGARALLATRPELVDEVDVPGDPADLDTPEDLSRWR